MIPTESSICFEAKLHCPVRFEAGASWTFLLLPRSVSAKLPRRGRTTVEGKLNGYRFQATLDPDGELSHWLRIDSELRKAAGANVGELVSVSISPVEEEPEPIVPIDLQQAFSAASEAQKVWNATTTLERVDWIHWIESAKQPKTRAKRIGDACEMLSSGKKRVCCFDRSGYYSKAFKAPDAEGLVDRVVSGA